jgi:superfamily II helicase
LGSNISFKCKQCADNESSIQSEIETCWSFNTGIGMIYSPENVFKGYEDEKPLLFSLVKSKKIQREVSESLNNGFAPSDGYGHEVYLCMHCMNFFSRFHFKLAKGNEVYEPRYLCSKCRKELIKKELVVRKGQYKVVDCQKKKVEWKCRVCGSDELVMDLSVGILMWD